MARPTLLARAAERVLLTASPPPRGRDAVQSELLAAISAAVADVRDAPFLRAAMASSADDAASCAGAGPAEAAGGRTRSVRR
jgi:hypothetical protein